MVKMAFCSIIFCMASTVGFADDVPSNPSPIQEIQNAFNLNPRNRLEPKIFDVKNAEAQVKIQWVSNDLDYQLIYKRIPDSLMNYIKNPLQEPSSGAVKILFLNQDGWEVTQRPCYLVDFTFNKDLHELICKNSIEALSMHSDINEYRRISSISVSIN